MHLAEGLATLAAVFPFLSRGRREHLIRAWSKRLLRIFALETRLSGTVHEERARGLVLVANHVSWLDIFVINAVQPARFIAKDDLKRWPLVGWLIAGVGTLFIDRRSRRHVHGMNVEVRAALANGDVVAVFPEGQIGTGQEVLPFHGSLLQPAVEAQGFVQPLAIRYCAADGTPTEAAAWPPDVTFLGSVWRVTGLRRLRVELFAFAPLPGGARHRRELARAAEAAIRAALAAPAGGLALGKADGHRAASR